MQNLLKQLKAENVGIVKINEQLSKHTTWKIGGPAELFVEPSSKDGLIKTLKLIRAAKVPWRTIGRGSNILISDMGLEGVTIKLGKGMDDLEVQGEQVTVGAGYPLVKLATIISRQGLSGLEFAGGIPGSVGGAVFMNAGAHSSDISAIFEKALVLFEDGRLEWLYAGDMEFAYRTTKLQQEPAICIEAVFNLRSGDRTEIVSKMQENKDYRKKSQPYSFPTCGSVFRNPLPHYAGHLIEEAGLKGYQIGGAQISELHANFIVNIGSATAKDVLDLIEHVKHTIFETKQIRLETEVELFGDRNEQVNT
ncbi:UDP-N-acetylmuramate dehydrogenase [Alkalicoccobacillus porphyridii]|uniref:UDP-N-acetylenolpyruvoylglucosamine reductase n=1 Tax=Alkalicoccobacillus porphyridii TaxID=2597270 RepID=A0A553ZY00_9BACI|nr:UDP-N-acetylmuramate dehydrogenase [Alkalicoccobacillus porphyridii]TSB46327.1 UDP-N-acetylmuramate dehydrogenase [Alkalicoccobacillus porphyridii]